MKRLTKRLEDGQAAMDCILCAQSGVVCHLLSCRNRLKNRLCDYEDVMQSNGLIKQKNGRWEQIGYDKAMDRISCSVCKEYWNICDNDTETFNYCPNCGAKMDGDGNGTA